MKKRILKVALSAGLAAALAVAPASTAHAEGGVTDAASGWAYVRDYVSRHNGTTPEEYTSFSSRSWGDQTQYSFQYLRDGKTVGHVLYVNADGTVAEVLYRSASNYSQSPQSDDDDDDKPSEKEIREMREAIRAAEKAAAAEAENVAHATTSTGVQSEASGSYMASSVDGTAVTTPKAEVAQSLGLAAGESAYVTTWDIDPTYSPAAAASLTAGAASVGGRLGPMLQVNLNKMVNGQIQALSPNAGAVNMSFGIPADFRANGGSFAVVRVVSGGAYEILPDKDNSPYTVTVDLPAGDGAYALVNLPN